MFKQYFKKKFETVYTVFFNLRNIILDVKVSLLGNAVLIDRNNNMHFWLQPEFLV